MPDLVKQEKENLTNELNSYVSNIYFQHKRDQFYKLIQKWGEEKLCKKILKIDLYEEATSMESEIAFSLAKKGDVVGIDICPNVVRMARKNCKQKMKFMEQDMTNMDKIKDGTFDLVLSHSTLDHVVDIEGAVKELYRVMKKDGILIVTINNRTNILYPFLKIVGKIIGPFFGAKSIYETYSFDVISFRRFIKRMGFQVEDSTGILFVTPIMPTIINWAYKNNIEPVKRFFKSYIRFMERVGKKNTWLNYLISMQVAVKARKV